MKSAAVKKNTIQSQKELDPKLQAWLDRGHRLRSEMFASEVALALYLVDGETEAPWQGVFASYDSLLEQANLMDVARFRSFVNGLQHINREDAPSIGVDGVIAIGKQESSKARISLQTLLLETNTRQGHPASEREVRRIQQQVSPNRPRLVDRPLTYDQLLAENKALREENAKLKAQISAMKAKK